MAYNSNSIALSAILLSFVLAIISLADHCHARHEKSFHHAIGRRNNVRVHHVIKQRKPNFKPGPWTKAHATFYDGSATSFGGACNYKDVVAEGFGLNTVATSDVLFKNGQTCGACYELKCLDDPKYCRLGKPSLIVTATDRCPPNPSQPADNGGWCNPPNHHFDIAKPVFSQLADFVAGVIPVEYRRVPCQRRGGIRFSISGNHYFYQVVIWNVGGAGDVTSVKVKGNKNVKWTQMERDWGSTWKTSAILQGESLTFRVKTSDGRTSTSWHVAPENWQFGQTFVGKNFK